MSDSLPVLLRILLTILFLGLGGLILAAGRHYLWLLVGGGLFIVAVTLAIGIQGLLDQTSFSNQVTLFILLGSVALGAVGVYIGLNHKALAADLIGFATGLYVAAWFDEILLVLNGQAGSNFEWWLVIPYVAMGVFGVWLTRRDREQAIILVSVVIGTNAISSTLNLDQTKSITAIMTLSLALAGVIIQYASMLRERPRFGKPLPPVPHPVSEEMPFE